jgi:hypothetical protein
LNGLEIEFTVSGIHVALFTVIPVSVMDETSRSKIGSRLRLTEAALRDLQRAETINQQRDAWFKYLVSHSAVFEALKAATSAIGGKQSAWYGRVKSERRNDELLAYLHHARDCEYHGLQESAEIESASASLLAGDWAILTFYGAKLGPDSTIADLKKIDPFKNANVSVDGKVVSFDYVLRLQTLRLYQDSLIMTCGPSCGAPRT